MTEPSHDRRTADRQGGARSHARVDTAVGPRDEMAEVYRRRRLVAVGVAVLLVVIGLWAVKSVRGADAADAPIDAPVAAPADGATLAADVAEVATFEPTIEETPEPISALIEDVACEVDESSIERGDSGDSVTCAQRALAAAGFYAGEPHGEFDDLTYLAAREFQFEVELFVDGIIGKNTATELGIWPGNEAFIIRTPPPAPGASDLWGMPLSSVASAGDGAPPLPEEADDNSGKRIVYDRASQRVWAVDDQERIVRSYLVSGSRFRNEVPGSHTIYSKSESALGWDLSADLPLMIRYTKTERGHIGFHAIPSWRDSGDKLQTENELGEKLSGGCTRQALLDAQFLWQFADVGDTVVVL